MRESTQGGDDLQMEFYLAQFQMAVQQTKRRTPYLLLEMSNGLAWDVVGR